MTEGICARAAYNNALWCHAVCSAHGKPGEFHDTLWLNRFDVPRYYPDAVTLTGATAAKAQTDAIRELLRLPRRDGWAVKDSFQCLDLSEIGFTPLFDAEWIGLDLPLTVTKQTPPNVRWRRVGDAAGLVRWDQEWRGGNAGAADSRVFMPGLLSDADIRFVVALDDEWPVAGGILNRGAGVVGISNVFTSTLDLAVVWQGLARYAANAFPGLPLVAYDRGEELIAARGVGFSTIGHLRVWHRLAPATHG